MILFVMVTVYLSCGFHVIARGLLQMVSLFESFHKFAPHKRKWILMGDDITFQLWPGNGILSCSHTLRLNHCDSLPSTNHPVLCLQSVNVGIEYHR